MPGPEKDFLRERGVVTEEQATLGKILQLFSSNGVQLTEQQIEYMLLLICTCTCL